MREATRSHSLTIPKSAPSLSHLGRVFALIWAAAGKWMIAWGVLLILQGLMPVAMVSLTKPLVDRVQAAIGKGASWETVQPVLIVALAIGGVLLLSELFKVGLEWLGAARAELVQDHINDLLHAKSTSVDLAFFETPEFYDRLYRARMESGSRPLALLESSGSVIQNGITVIAMAAVLLPYGAWLPPALLVSTLPAFYVVVRASRRHHRWWTDSTTDRRRTQYFSTVVTDAFYAAEVRFFGLASFFRNAYLKLRRHLRVERLRLLRDQSLARVGAEVVALAVSAGAIAWMIWRAFLGLATLGDIALFQQAFQRGQGLMRALLTNISQIYTNSLFLVNLFEFLDLEPRVIAPSNAVPLRLPLTRGIRFEDVTFRYPGTDRVALRNFDVAIPARSTVAIVGANGAGKTTLLKLLCRFYDPEAGHITIDGVDLRDVSPAELRSMITVMFQTPVTYQDTARANIAMSSVEAARSSGNIEDAARSAGAHELISSLPAGYDTPLGKWFPGGTELSGGEWQRLALARAYLRKSEIIILDEPTSFMDSWAEAEWLDRFRVLARNRTAIIITHRLTIAMRADTIHVMRDGRIIESGTHQELVSLDGLYARSWRSQMESAAPAEEIQAAL